jgi:hypothetical protein
MHDYFSVVVGVSFGRGTGGGVWLLVSTASVALCIHYSVYVLEAALQSNSTLAMPLVTNSTPENSQPHKSTAGAGRPSSLLGGGC